MAAVALAAIGTVVIVGYVNGAEDRALAGEEVVKVLVVTDQIPAGTPAEDIGDRVKIEQVVEKVKADGAVIDVDDLKGKVASATLVPGEQVIEKRFVEATAYRAGTNVAVPDGMLQTTVSLSPDRAVGGVLSPGTKVAVSMSFEATKTAQNADGATSGDTSDQLTHMTLRKVLVTRVQIDESAAADTPDDSADEANLTKPADAPTSNLLITLAIDDVNTERLVWAAEHGTLWLSVEEDDTPVGPTKIVTEENVLS
ncbi:MAG TPA: RcpC/CpaB family pilus assembly protein [Acidimicrobiia bacterium]|nr:RcpC/CpaB family pilus assembly protein [Acidimicrobiia bacterium]